MVGNLPPATKCVSRACLLLALSLALFSACAWPQTQLATVFGIITDTSGAVVPGAEVSVENVSTGLKRGAVTDMKGQYQLAGLPTGRYTLRVEKEGFQTEVREGIALTPGAAIGINLSLVVGKLSVHVTVEAGVPSVDTTTTTVEGMIAERSLTALPLEGRDLFKAAILVQGVAPT